MNYSRIPALVLGPLMILLFADMTAFACWCRSAGPVLDEFESSKLVLVTRIVSVEKEQAKLIIERVFKGNAKVGDELKFAQGDFNDCVRRFDAEEVGQKY